MVNMEAQLCGTAVVSYRTGGCPETRISEKCQFVERGDIRSLAKAVQSAKFSGAIDTFKLDQFTLSYLKLYKEIR